MDDIDHEAAPDNGANADNSTVEHFFKPRYTVETDQTGNVESPSPPTAATTPLPQGTTVLTQKQQTNSGF